MKIQRANHVVFEMSFNQKQYRALAKLADRYPFVDERGKLHPRMRQAGVAAQNLILLGLAHFEKSTALLQAAIGYCQAEGLVWDDLFGIADRP